MVSNFSYDINDKYPKISTLASNIQHRCFCPKNRRKIQKTSFFTASHTGPIPYPYRIHTVCSPSYLPVSSQSPCRNPSLLNAPILQKTSKTRTKPEQNWEIRAITALPNKKGPARLPVRSPAGGKNQLLNLRSDPKWRLSPAIIRVFRNGLHLRSLS
ncbi:hypothetical protein D9M69_482540 [compost metagenome]